MNRRKLFGFLGAVAAIPVVGVERKVYANETIHLYEPLLLDGHHISNCEIYLHGEDCYIGSVDNPVARSYMINCDIDCSDGGIGQVVKQS